MPQLRRKAPSLVVPFNLDDTLRRRPLAPDQDYVAPPPVFHEPTPTLAELGPPPMMIRRNNKQRPLEALGGADDLQRDEALYEAQQAYKAPRSTKDLLLRLAQGFIGGGLPGAAAQGIGYELNPEIRNQDAVGSDMAQTRGRIQRTLTRRNTENDWMNDQSVRDYRDAQTQGLMRQPEKDRAAQAEQERDNLRQLYNSLPAFDATNNPQHKAMADRAAALRMMLPNRDEKDSWSLEWVNGQLKRVSKSTGKVLDTGQTDITRVPVLEDGLSVTPGQALNARSVRENRDYQRTEKQTENATKRQAKLKEAADLIANAEIYENNASEAEKDVANPDLDQVSASAAAAKVNTLRQEAQQLRRQAAAARAEGEAIPVSPTKYLDPALEQRIRAAAKAKNLNPDIAVQRALARQ